MLYKASVHEFQVVKPLKRQVVKGSRVSKSVIGGQKYAVIQDQDEGVEVVTMLFRGGLAGVLCPRSNN